MTCCCKAPEACKMETSQCNLRSSDTLFKVPPSMTCVGFLSIVLPEITEEQIWCIVVSDPWLDFLVLDFLMCHSPDLQYGRQDTVGFQICQEDIQGQKYQSALKRHKNHYRQGKISLWCSAFKEVTLPPLSGKQFPDQWQLQVSTATTLNHCHSLFRPVAE